MCITVRGMPKNGTISKLLAVSDESLRMSFPSRKVLLRGKKIMSKTVYTWGELATYLNELHQSGQMPFDMPVSACGLSGLSIEIKEGHLVIDEPAD